MSCRLTILLRHGAPQVLNLEPKRHRAVAWSSRVSRQPLHKQNESHPKNLLLQAQHLILTGVPIPGNVRAAVAMDRGTRFRFSAAFRSSLVSALPHFGQRAEKSLSFGGRFLFMCDARMTANIPAQARRGNGV